MFNNRFNSTNKDPLVEAVRQAQQDGDMRRQAEAIVNEEFGVYSRQAVVRENLAAYDARLEEAYKYMKEGNKENKEKKKEHEEKTGLEHIKKMGGFPGQSLKRTARSLTKEGNDGNLANNYPPYDKVTRGDVIAGATGKDQMGGKKKMNEKKGCYEEGMDSDVVGGGAVTKDSKPVVSSTAPKADTSGPSASEKSALTSKISAMREAKLDEISTKLATRYTKKSFKDMKQAADFGDTMSIRNRAKGIETASKKLTGGAKVRTTEETLDEAVSRKHFQQVADLIKSHDSQEKRNELASHHASIFAKQNPRFDHGRFHKAAGSTAHEAPKKMEEAAYSAKAARAGKDIGKPGKMFAQIAAKAGEKYGSQERGKKVAGAILKKIRAKHVKEENLEELSQFGSAFAAARKAGQSTFNMGGKSYSTALKGSSSTPTPPSRPSSVSTPKTNTPGTQGVATGKSFADIDRKKMTASATDDMAAKATAKAFFKPGADPNAPKNVPSSTSASMPASERSSIPTPPSSASADKAGLPPRRPESLGGSSAPASSAPAPAPQAGAPKDDASAGVKKVMSTMNEEVQIGDYKYRIV